MLLDSCTVAIISHQILLMHSFKLKKIYISLLGMCRFKKNSVLACMFVRMQTISEFAPVGVYGGQSVKHQWVFMAVNQ